VKGTSEFFAYRRSLSSFWAGLYYLIMFGVKHILKRLFSNWGVQRGEAPLTGVWGCPPAWKSPKTGGFRGFITVTKRPLLNKLHNLHFT